MKPIIALCIVLLFCGIAPLHAMTVEEARTLMDQRMDTYLTQLVAMRDAGEANHSSDLVEVGIHNLRILDSGNRAICHNMTDNNPTTQGIHSTLDSCLNYANIQRTMAHSLLHTTMTQDIHEKKSTLYQQRLLTFNEHLRNILDIVVSIRGTLTKVQSGITSTAEQTMVR